ncbi:HAD family hydrolase [Pendulispora rubella]|uniref:HAD family hydrolase n=1 Tax=Pendulispora rubella TaxID=2741070 RepID=A0ABZ2L9K1_9BACT
MIELVAFDADDTLWHNESIFTVTQEKFLALMKPFVSSEGLEERLVATEIKNSKLFGYGIKAFMLSMIETAIELSEERVGARQIQEIIDAGRAMLQHPVELLPGAADAVAKVSETHKVMLITKGDLLDQESKLARSGLGDRFSAVEIVSEKRPATYERILTRLGVAPEKFLMVGNSLKSDVVPALDIGAVGVHVPYHTTWAAERVEDEAAVRKRPRFHHLDSLAELPALLARLDTTV